jgi:glutathione S-transferase
VPAEPGEREQMRAATGTEEIPVLVLDDGTVIEGTKKILEHVFERYPRRADADRHRVKLHEEAAERDPQKIDDDSPDG